MNKCGVMIRDPFSVHGCDAWHQKRNPWARKGALASDDSKSAFHESHYDHTSRAKLSCLDIAFRQLT